MVLSFGLLSVKRQRSVVHMKFIIRDEKDEALFKKTYRRLVIIVAIISEILMTSMQIALMLFLQLQFFTLAQCYLCWLLFTVPFLEFCFAFYSWIASKHSIGSKVWIEEKAS